MVLDVDAAQGVRTLAGHILHTHAKDGKIFKFMGGEEVYGIFCDGGIEELQKLGEYFPGGAAGRRRRRLGLVYRGAE